MPGHEVVVLRSNRCVNFIALESASSINREHGKHDDRFVNATNIDLAIDGNEIEMHTRALTTDSLRSCFGSFDISYGYKL